MPESYSSFGEAAAAAMQHNIRLAHSGWPSPPTQDAGSAPAGEPLQVRFIPHPSQDPDSVPGMIVRLTEDAAPRDVAAMIEEVTGALTGAMPQLIEFVAAAADWTRARLDYDHPDYSNAYDTWMGLHAAHLSLGAALDYLDSAIDPVSRLPAQTAAPDLDPPFPVLRTRDLLHDVMGARPDEPAEQPDAAARSDRRHAALASSPQAASRSARPSPVAPPPESPRSPTTAHRSR